MSDASGLGSFNNVKSLHRGSFPEVSLIQLPGRQVGHAPEAGGNFLPRCQDLRGTMCQKRVNRKCLPKDHAMFDAYACIVR